MQWLYGLFIRPEIHAFIQNYIDDPHRWKYDPDLYRFENKKDNLLIEFQPHFSRVYKYTGRQISYEEDLRIVEQRLLCSAFRRLIASTARPIPTKATHPEEFI